MENHPDHHHHHDHGPDESQPTESHVKLALSTTLHCLLGCGLGEVVGVVIATARQWTATPGTMQRCVPVSPMST